MRISRRSACYLALLLGALPISLPAEASATAPRRDCRRACIDEIAECVDLGGKLRRCRRQLVRECRREGIATCLLPGEPFTMEARGWSLSTPDGVEAVSLGDATVWLSWNDGNTNESGYAIERSAGPADAFQLHADLRSNTTSFQDHDVLTGLTYAYRLRAYRQQGKNTFYSGYSEVVEATVDDGGGKIGSTTTTSTSTSTSTSTTIAGGDTTAPSVPTGLTTTILSCSSVRLRWDPSSDEPGGSGLAGYRVYRWNAAFVRWDWFANSGTTTYDATGLADGTTHYFAVTAYDVAGNESYRSAWVTVTLSVCGGTTTTSTSTTSTTTSSSTSTSSTSSTSTSTSTTATSPTSTSTSTSTSTTAPSTSTTSSTSSSTSSTSSSSTSSSTSSTTSTSTTTSPSTTTSTTVATGSAWARGVASPGFNSGHDMAVDANGRVTVVGQFAGTVNFGGGPVTSAAFSWHDPATVQDGFVAQYTAAGAYRWAKRIGNEGHDAVTAVTVDGSGNVIVVGSLRSWEVDLGGGPTVSLGDEDMFVVKYDASGSHLWSRRVGGSRAEAPAAVAVDGSGNVWVVGRFFETTNLGGATLSAAGGLDQDGFIVKYSSTGTHLWSRALGGTGYDEARGVDVDASGNAIVTGWFAGSANFGGSTLTSAGGNDVFVAKYGSTGAHVWSRRYGGTGADEGRAVAVDPATSEIVVTGNFAGSTSFGGSTLTSAGSNDVFVAKYGSTGAHVWSRRAGGTSADSGRAVAIGAAGQVVVAGSFARTIDFGTGAHTAAGATDAFVVRYSASGAPVASDAYGGTQGDQADGVAVASDGTTVVTGAFRPSIALDSGTLTSDGSTDGFVGKLAW
jgi:hypothetical protein